MTEITRRPGMCEIMCEIYLPSQVRVQNGVIYGHARLDRKHRYN
jgi:hypothetical protein